MFEDEPPITTGAGKRARVETPPLDTWSVGELGDYIEELRSEIARAEAQISRKQDHRSAADAFFRPAAPEPP